MQKSSNMGKYLKISSNMGKHLEISSNIGRYFQISPTRRNRSNGSTLFQLTTPPASDPSPLLTKQTTRLCWELTLFYVSQLFTRFYVKYISSLLIQQSIKLFWPTLFSLFLRLKSSWQFFSRSNHFNLMKTTNQYHVVWMNKAPRECQNRAKGFLSTMKTCGWKTQFSFPPKNSVWPKTFPFSQYHFHCIGLSYLSRTRCISVNQSISQLPSFL